MQFAMPNRSFKMLTRGKIFFIFFMLQRALAEGEESEKDKFVVSFQKDGGWSTDEWMEYKKEIPFLKEFTTCYWDRLRYFSADYVSVWQYC